jgi:hypothetical protein
MNSFCTVLYCRLPGLVPSLAIVVGKCKEVSFPGKITRVQAIFKNSFAIVQLGDDDDWDSFQMTIPSGELRLIPCEPTSVAVFHLIMNIAESMRDTEKFKLQTKYFIELENYMKSPEKAKSLFRQLCSFLDIPSNDAEVLMEAVPSMAQMMTIDLKSFQEVCPVEIQSINKIFDFFNK